MTKPTHAHLIAIKSSEFASTLFFYYTNLSTAALTEDCEENWFSENTTTAASSYVTRANWVSLRPIVAKEPTKALIKFLITVHCEIVTSDESSTSKAMSTNEQAAKKHLLQNYNNTT